MKLTLLGGVAALVAAVAVGAGAKAAGPPLAIERTIPLPDVQGRIDHMAFAPKRQVLFIGEVGAGALDAIDLKSGRRIARVDHLQEPQGVAYLAAADEVAVGCGGDGTVRFYAAGSLKPVATVALKGDADNLRLDPSGRLIAADGAGFAVIDPVRHVVVSRVEVGGHPEGFQIDPDGRRLVANVPRQHRVIVADLTSGRVTSSWGQLALMNFPMALARSGEAATVFRLPSQLLVFDSQSGRTIARTGACGDSDDLHFDPARARLYVSCGSGGVEVFDTMGHAYRSLGLVKTRSGARTSLFIREIDRLVVAARDDGGQGAAVLVLKATP